MCFFELDGDKTYKTTHAFYDLESGRNMKRPIGKQTLDQDEIYIYEYDEELGRDIGKWIPNPMRN